ncbi:outer membrane beta-barrel protein [Veronia pacifica]|uniref:Porin n=2 Tax=Veronia pacifica TaxID=1080227 RepID=A0A1C3ECE3_9GAMM|nr:outer membrane beta-barrel protein [Veronia pacifica]ODA30926.1 hypothetical protein A8L45_18645 [Veronia pacifica]
MTDSSFEYSKISVNGWIEATALNASDTLDGELSNGAFFNQKDGIRLNQAGLMLCRGVGCLPTATFPPSQNLLSRIGPLPGPVGELEIGFNVTAVYGEDSQFLRTAGIDDYTFDDDKDNKLAIPQFYIDAYLPVFGGMTVIAGSFFTSTGNEIGLPFTPPNWFATHTYAMQHAPSKHVGVLTGIKIPTSDAFGLLSVDLGLVGGWNNWDERRPTVIGATRWRSNDMATWLDIELIYGDGEGDAFGPAKGGSPYLVASTNGEKRQRLHSSATLTHNVNPDTQISAELTYGSQKGGDIAPAPVFIVEDSKWYGANLATRFKVSEELHTGVRAEWFNDEKAANILWRSTGATGGSVYSLTANLDWSLNPHLRIRPEIRYDKYEGDGAGLFAGGKSDQQFIALINAVTYF